MGAKVATRLTDPSATSGDSWWSEASYSPDADQYLVIWQQYGAYIDAQAACTQGLSACPPRGVEMYTPYLMLVFMGWVDVFLLLIISGIIEDRTKRRWPDPSQL